MIDLNIDTLIPGPQQYGPPFAEAVSLAAMLAGPDAPPRDLAVAAAVVAASVPYGRDGSVATITEAGAWTCAARADLAVALTRACAADLAVRHAGWWSVGGQVSHSTYEVCLPGTGWAYFDTSAGLMFTEDGSTDGRILSLAELVARAEAGLPFGAVRFAQPRAPLSELAAALPARPLRDMIEPVTTYPKWMPYDQWFATKTAVGGFDPNQKIVSHQYVDIAAADTEIVYAVRNGNRFERNATFGFNPRHRRAMLDFVGIGRRGVNMVQLLHITRASLVPYRVYLLYSPSRPLDLVSLTCIEGCRELDRSSQRHTGTGAGYLFDLAATILPTTETPRIMIDHTAQAAGEQAYVRSLSLTRLA